MKNNEMIKALMSKEKSRELVEKKFTKEEQRSLTKSTGKRKVKKSRLDKNEIIMGACG